MTKTLPRREDVPQDYTWNIESIFARPTDWEEAFAALEEALPTLPKFQGRLTESPAVLLNWLKTVDGLGQQMGKIQVYAQSKFDAEITNQTHAALVSRAQGLQARFSATIAFAEPELLAAEPATIEQFMAAEPALRLYQHFFDNLQRQRAHVRSTEIEHLLAQSSEPLNTSWNAYQALSYGELSFKPVSDSEGRNYSVAQGTIEELLRSSDRTLRKAAWNSYADGHTAVKNTLAALLAGNVQTNVFKARARCYASAREAALAVDNIPVAVYNNVIESCNRNLPIWHRYWEIRRRVLGLPALEACDIFAPLIEDQPEVPYSQAIEWICAGMRPLGEEYVQVMRNGLTRERWVDIYPNQNKRGGAYSSGSYDTHPFILMSYTNDMESMSTMAHELGHSMHSYFARTHQPSIYSEYTLFVAEVASNFNQALTRAFLLEQHPDRHFQIVIIEEAMRNFHRYLFLMPILAQFELHIHGLVEQNRALTADDMSDFLSNLFKQGYGPAMQLDEPRTGITWAQFPHLYVSFYVYQYASGIAAANTLADSILSDEAGAVDNYLAFLKAGNALYPLDALKLAGVDMTSPEPMDRAFKVLERFVDQLDQLFPA